ncbi:hypothetical protein [Paenibacillus sp. LHD-38]|uniref:hypothetical protein n=1 Tax=Paenibacillus sp. LHD-38 TaxID=3072143 RepID=UPI00280EDD0B|nr:hypothetical protein [Paenibacillus sp. LHD-38]MDQ8734226.1 hypothetical protein [Paenibacillus sp. LHD-38]
MCKVLVMLCTLVLTSCSSMHLKNVEEVNISSVIDIPDDDIAIILNAAKDKLLPGFAGVYKNNADQLIIGLVEGSEETRQMILNMAMKDDKILFFSAQFTKDELELQMERLNKELPNLQKKGLVFNDFGISTKDNRLVVNVPRDDLTNFELITEVIEKKYILFRVTEEWREF